MTRMWEFASHVGWRKAHGWIELRRETCPDGVVMVLMQHDETIDVEKAFEESERRENENAN